MALETAVIDISYKRGDSKAIVFTLKNKDTGVVIDVTTYTAAVMSVHTIASPPDITTEEFKVTGSIGGADGKITFVPTVMQTDIGIATYFYDAQVVDGGSSLITFVEGKFKVTQDRAKD